MTKLNPTLSIAMSAIALLARDAKATVAGAMPSRLADTVVIDSFDSLSQWHTNPSAGVEVSIHPDSGIQGRAMRVDFDFHGRKGYWIVHRDLGLNLPPNYRFNFALRGEAPANNFEFKLVDADRASVWWSRELDFNLPREWRSITRQKRQICYGWGGAARRYYETHQLSAIEFAMSTGAGGKGSVWIDELTLTPLDVESVFTFTAPIASNPLVGTWESEISDKGGTGAKLDFEQDGTFRSVVGVMAPFKYSVDKDRLTTVFGDPATASGYTFTNSFHITNGVLEQTGQNLMGRDLVMRRIGTPRPDSDLRGVWTWNDSFGGPTFVAYDENGKAELRVTQQTCSGTWKEVRPGRVSVTLNGETSERDYSIEGDVLTVKYPDFNLKYRRRTHAP